METDFFGTGETYQITVTKYPPEGMIFDERRDIRRYVFWDKREYIHKRIDLLETPGIESIFCIETHTTTILSTSRKNKIE